MVLTMKANEVLNLLRITRKTLHVYAATGKIRYTVMPNGYYDYSDEDVYKLLNKDVKRKTVIYARVSTNKQKKDLFADGIEGIGSYPRSLSIPEFTGMITSKGGC
jgi:predicted site-specific integrase-resolvase